MDKFQENCLENVIGMSSQKVARRQATTHTQIAVFAIKMIFKSSNNRKTQDNDGSYFGLY